MKLRRFSQLGWHGCMDLVAAAAGHHVERVDLGEAPKMPEPKSLDEEMDDRQELVEKYQAERGRSWGVS